MQVSVEHCVSQTLWVVFAEQYKYIDFLFGLWNFTTLLVYIGFVTLLRYTLYDEALIKLASTSSKIIWLLSINIDA